MFGTIGTHLPRPLRLRSAFCYCILEDHTFRFSVQLSKGPLKLFIRDYKNYDYLTEEKRIVPKSLSRYGGCFQKGSGNRLHMLSGTGWFLSPYYGSTGPFIGTASVPAFLLPKTVLSALERCDLRSLLPHSIYHRIFATLFLGGYAQKSRGQQFSLHILCFFLFFSNRRIRSLRLSDRKLLMPHSSPASSSSWPTASISTSANSAPLSSSASFFSGASSAFILRLIFFSSSWNSTIIASIS